MMSTAYRLEEVILVRIIFVIFVIVPKDIIVDIHRSLLRHRVNLLRFLSLSLHFSLGLLQFIILDNVT